MPFERVPIKSADQWRALRGRDITASVIGALLGVHEYTTAFEQWALKSGRLVADDLDNRILRRGRLLEPVAFEVLKEERPDWKQSAPAAYFRDGEIRLGATPDLFVECPERGKGTIQVKTTADIVFRQKWQDPTTKDVVLPLWIALQAITEAHLTGRSWAAVAVMVVGMGLDLHVIDVPVRKREIDLIRSAAVAFWKLVDSGEEPAPDYGRDMATLSRLYAEDAESALDLSDDARVREMLVGRAKLTAAVKLAEDEKKRIDAELIHRLGNASAAFVGEGKAITYRTTHRPGFEVEPTTYRVLRCPVITS